MTDRKHQMKKCYVTDWNDPVKIHYVTDGEHRMVKSVM